MSSLLFRDLISVYPPPPHRLCPSANHYRCMGTKTTVKDGRNMYSPSRPTVQYTISGIFTLPSALLCHGYWLNCLSADHRYCSNWKIRPTVRACMSEISVLYFVRTSWRQREEAMSA